MGRLVTSPADALARFTRVWPDGRTLVGALVPFTRRRATPSPRVATHGPITRRRATAIAAPMAAPMGRLAPLSGTPHNPPLTYARTAGNASHLAVRRRNPHMGTRVPDAFRSRATVESTPIRSCASSAVRMTKPLPAYRPARVCPPNGLVANGLAAGFSRISPVVRSASAKGTYGLQGCGGR